MKKVFTFLCIALLLFSSSAFAISQSEYAEVIEQRDALYQQIIDSGLDPVLVIPDPTIAPDPFSHSSGDYQVSEYIWSSANYHHCDLVIKNTSGNDCEIEVAMIFYDESDTMIGVANASQRACQNGFETYYSLYNEHPFDHVKYSITMSPESYYSCIQSDLDFQYSVVNNKVIMSARNTSERSMEYVRYDILYLDESGSVVEIDYGYITDSDSEIKPGATQYKDSISYVDFSSVVIVCNGRADNH